MGRNALPEGDEPAARAVRAFFAWPVRLTRWLGCLPVPRERRGAEGAGISGHVNLRVGGAGDWYLALSGDRVGVCEGLAPAARATLSLAARDLAAMLAGRQAPATAQMTGRVRLSGDGEMVFLLGVLVAQFQRARTAPGLRGWPARRYARRVLRPLEAPGARAGGPR